MSNDNAEKHPLQRLLEQVDANVQPFRRRADVPNLQWFTTAPVCLAVEVSSLAAFVASMVETIVAVQLAAEPAEAIVQALHHLEWNGFLVLFPTVSYVDDPPAVPEPPQAA